MSSKFTDSSCYVFDIRNSTNVIRKSLETDNADFLRFHSEFMIDTYIELEIQIRELGVEDRSYTNDTGDGHICMIQGANHALLIFKLSSIMALHIKKEMKRYNRKLKIALNETETIDFGIGMHSDMGFIVKEVGGKRFGYGNTINTAARVESSTKLFKEKRILLTGDFKKHLSSIDIEFEQVATGLDIKDWGSMGHDLFSVKEKDWKKISELKIEP